MTSYQLSLWDNLDSRNGYTALAALELSEAAVHFQTALINNRIAENEIKEALEAIKYWKPVLADKGKISTEKFLGFFASLEFAAHLTIFKKAILKSSVSLIKQAQILIEWEKFFDLLIENLECSAAVELLEKIKRVQPENYSLYYYFGHAYYEKGDHINSNDSYGKALCLYPSFKFISRINCDRIRKLITEHGVYMAYLYGRLKNLFYPCKIPTSFFPTEQQHRHAISLYNLLREAEDESNITDRNKQISLRKKMKEIDPQFLLHFLNTIRV